MIAAAMTSRKFSVPTYVDLAKAGARIERDIDPQLCSRLALECTNLVAIKTELSFFMDDQSRPNVAGTATATLELLCQACSSPVPLEIKADVAGILVRSETQAQMLKSADDELDLIIVTSPELNEVELVEDELLLRLPSQVCVDTDCERRPVMSYGPLDEDLTTDTHRPFAALAQLQRNAQTTSGSEDEE